MKDLLRRAFVENGTLKIVALLLAVTLYIAVRGDRDTTMSFYLRVAYTEPADRVMTSKPVDALRVTVTGSWSRVRHFDGRDVEPLQVDLTRLSDGDYIFQADTIRLPAGLRVVSINPPSIRLTFEERGHKVVPVRADTVGALVHGYRLDRLEVAPAVATVRGAHSVIGAITEVRTQPVSLDGRSSSFEARVALAPTEANVTVDGPPTIVVRVMVSESLAVMTLPGVPLRIRPANGALPVKAGVRTSTDKVRVVLRGPENALDELDRARITAHVNWHAEDDKATHARLARVDIEGVPPGVAIEVEPREVTLLPR
jgi:YbbR domain-containing protein